MNKPNCYECKHRQDLIGDAHSQCVHPKIGNPLAHVINMLMFARKNNPLEIKGNDHGINKGWFNWPINFDPLWLENCNGFESKEENG